MKEFNKKNMLKFARSLYYEKGEYCHYKPLCHGQLAKLNGEITGCALGEMYEYFEEKPVYKFLTKEEIERFQLVGTGFEISISEEEIVDTLIERAQIQQAKIRWQTTESLYDALRELPSTNDAFKGETEEAHIYRAKAVRKRLEEIANEYLK